MAKADICAAQTPAGMKTMTILPESSCMPFPGWPTILCPEWNKRLQSSLFTPLDDFATTVCHIKRTM